MYFDNSRDSLIATARQAIAFGAWTPTQLVGLEILDGLTDSLERGEAPGMLGVVARVRVQTAPQLYPSDRRYHEIMRLACRIAFAAQLQAGARDEHPLHGSGPQCAADCGELAPCTAHP